MPDLEDSAPDVDAQGNPLPGGLAASGDRLWRSIADEYELDVHEQLLLMQACRCVDYLDRLAEDAANGTVTVTNFKGDQVAHPAMVEHRQQSIVLSRLLASLRVPSGEQEETKPSRGRGANGRPQRRGAARGAYKPRPLASVPSA